MQDSIENVSINERRGQTYLDHADCRNEGSNTNHIESTSKNTLRERGICVVIPTFNNAGTIVDVVTRTLQQCDDVIVVCDGCTDGTAELVDTISGIEIVSYKENKGKGTALKHGFMKALELGFSYAITLDADGQHFPEDIHLLLEANIQNPGALLIGQRTGLENADRSFGSKFANAFSNFWFCVQTGKLLKDTQTGYRLYPLKKLSGINFLTSRYEAELELLVFSYWKGIPLVSVPVNVYYPSQEERVSHFRPGLDFARISVLNTCLCVLAIIYGLPLKIWRSVACICRTLHALTVYLVACFFILLPYTFILQFLKTDREKKSQRLHNALYRVARFIMHTHGIPGVKYRVDNPKENFKSPAIVICNHQSHLDLMIMLSQTPKMVVLTNDWVWKSKFFGKVIRSAEFYPVSMGIECLLPKLQDLVERGYCIAVYPEGTRSKDCKIARFHKGAFHIAEALKLDIVPVIEYGAGHVLPKYGKYLRRGHIAVQINERFPYSEYVNIGSTKEITSWFRKYYKTEYARLCNKFDQDA